MAREVKLPDLGEDIEEAEVTAVLVSKGDRVEAEQPLFELESEKAAFELPAPTAGVVAAIRVSEGDVVRVGQVVAELDVEGDSEAEAASEGDGDAEEAPEPDTGEGAAESDGQPEDEAAKAAGSDGEEVDDSERGAEGAEAREPADDRERRPRGDGEEDEADAREVGGEPATRAEPSARGDPAPAPPSVRRLARELGVDVDDVAGSGPAGRVSEDDVKAYVRARLAAGARTRGEAAGGVPELPDQSVFGDIERVPLRSLRRATLEQMTRSWERIPHVTQSDVADVTELEATRRRLREDAPEGAPPLTITAIAIRILAAAARRYPAFNASLDLARGEAVLKQYVHIGVAVDTPFGLVAPVIRDADQKSGNEIATELAELAARARKRKLRRGDLQGASITLSNLGSFGTTTFSPLIHWPQVSVLGLGRARPELRLIDGEPRERLLLPLSLSYDHRWIDGAGAARFTRWIAQALEEPLLVLVGEA